jgi:hypothetical protein
VIITAIYLLDLSTFRKRGPCTAVDRSRSSVRESDDMKIVSDMTGPSDGVYSRAIRDYGYVRVCRDACDRGRDDDDGDDGHVRACVLCQKKQAARRAPFLV